MALFMIVCRATGRRVSTGIRISGSTWNSGAEFYAYTRCPACESYHQWCSKDVILGDEAEAANFVAATSKDQRLSRLATPQYPLHGPAEMRP